MEDRSNKTIMSSVLFLDIVEYSKKSVTGQISLKERFNAYLAEAIQDMPVADRIILDTGDGAAVNFLGDVEDALKAALSLRASLLNEDAQLEPELLVRIGINLGPVRLMRDLNGQPNIVGDGINVAQRVMGFADPGQILVSRSYYDAVSRLSAQYADMFHYQGSRTDKHVREHEVYAIGYPGEYTTKKMLAKVFEEAQSQSVGMMGRAQAAYSALAKSMNKRRLAWLENIKKADTKQRTLYAAVVLVPLLIGWLAVMHGPSKVVQPDLSVETMPSASVEPVIAEKVDVGSAASSMTARQAAEQPKSQQPSNKSQPENNKSQQTKKRLDTPAQSAENKTQSKAAILAVKKTASEQTQGGSVKADAEAFILVLCKEGSQVFVDGSQKGTISSSGSTTVTAKPGKHKIIINHASFGIYTNEVDLEPGKIERVSPKVCR